jgi:hypothetical protein
MTILPIFATLAPLEKISRYTPLGIRFWDLAADVAISTGLEVTARPPGRPQLARRAFQTASGVYAFQDLPGLHRLEASDPESPAGVHPIEGSPPIAARFVIDVRDHLQRFLPVTFQVDLPYRGVYPTQPTGSSPGASLPGFFLFSAPTRQALSNLAVVRAQLVERLGPDQFRPARFAVLELQIAGRRAALGVADEKGTAAVYFPYPPFATAVGPCSPPPGPPETRLQSWDVRVQARYRLAAQRPPDVGARLPDLATILTQPSAAIWATPAGPGQAQLPVRLIFGQPLVLQTAGNSELWIESSS